VGRNRVRLHVNQDGSGHTS